MQTGRKPRLVINNGNPQKAPPAPEHLDEAAKAEWEKVAPELASAGHLPESTYGLVTMYCEAVSAAADCARILRESGRMINVAGLPPKPHPAVRQQLQYQNLALRYAAELGLTAISKQRAKKGAANAASTSIFD
jgi:P27 family predicted phage terminase small subunit